MTPREFWGHVDVRGPDDCWEWQGPRRHAKGYGRVCIDGIETFAHRVALASTGVDLTGLCACHRCDNPPCCNPAHLFPGTRGDNASDMHRKGRGNPCRGESNGVAKLTEAKVREIREALRQGSTQREIAAHHGVAQTLISQVNRRKVWAHVG